MAEPTVDCLLDVLGHISEFHRRTCAEGHRWELDDLTCQESTFSIEGSALTLCPSERVIVPAFMRGGPSMIRDESADDRDDRNERCTRANLEAS